jgi:hypothetical protein
VPSQVENPQSAIYNPQSKIPAMSPRNRLLLALAALALLALTARLYFANRSQSQLASSPEVFQTVDALFTAVTAHDATRLADCQRRLADFKNRGSLPAAAAKRLDRIISLAESGDWPTAAHRLYDFMQAQTRTTAPSRSHQQLTAIQPR